jgi:hypothetical protein
MSEQRNTKRIRERLEISLPVRIRCREAVDIEWTEITRLVDVTPYGAGFKVKRPIEVGRLVHMTIPLPRQLRVFDHVEDQYRVWGLVRYVRPLPQPDGTSVLFEVGVAFIGKQPPRSYEEDPARLYEIGNITLDQLSPVKEWEPTDLTINADRTQTRHNIPVDLLVEIFNEKGEVELSEQAVTENISEQGAAIYSALTLPVGRVVRLTSQQYKLSVYAAVRGNSIGPSGMPRVHVKFIDRMWPL